MQVMLSFLHFIRLGTYTLPYFAVPGLTLEFLGSSLGLSIQRRLHP